MKTFIVYALAFFSVLNYAGQALAGSFDSDSQAEKFYNTLRHREKLPLEWKETDCHYSYSHMYVDQLYAQDIVYKDTLSTHEIKKKLQGTGPYSTLEVFTLLPDEAYMLRHTQSEKKIRDSEEQYDWKYYQGMTLLTKASLSAQLLERAIQAANDKVQTGYELEFSSKYLQYLNDLRDSLKG